MLAPPLDFGYGEHQESNCDKQSVSRRFWIQLEDTQAGTWRTNIRLSLIIEVGALANTHLTLLSIDLV